jgi:DNA gyrase subunit A
MLITRHGIVNRQRVSEIRVIGRATQGVRVMALDEGDVLMDVARVVPEEDNGDPVPTEQPVTGDDGAAAGVFAADVDMLADDPFANPDDDDDMNDVDDIDDDDIVEDDTIDDE